MAEVEVLVVCEGEDRSFDVRILKRVLEHHGVRARVVPAGDAVTLGALRATLGYDERVSFSIKDRDFLRAAPTIAPKPRKLRWRCHEIENFLVAPAVVHAAFDRLRGDLTGSLWLAQAPPDLSGVSALLRELGAALMPRHAGGLMSAARSQRSTTNNPATFRRPSPPDVERLGWPNALAQEARRVVLACQALAADPLFQEAPIRAEWTRQLSDLSASDFITSGRYLVDMEGKALLGALHARLRSWGAKVSQDDFASEALVPALFSLLGTADEPTDFRDLAEHIRHHAAVA